MRARASPLFAAAIKMLRRAYDEPRVAPGAAVDDATLCRSVDQVKYERRFQVLSAVGSWLFPGLPAWAGSRPPNPDSRPLAAVCHFGSSLEPRPARLWRVPGSRFPVPGFRLYCPPHS